MLLAAFLLWSSPIAPPQVEPPPATDGPEIVVIANKLRRMRIDYAARGRMLLRCSTSLSQSEPALDRIGCAILRAYVAEGVTTQRRALACINRRIASLDDGEEAALADREALAALARPAPPPRVALPASAPRVTAQRSDDIIVTGQRLRVERGLWAFERSPTLELRTAGSFARAQVQNRREPPTIVAGGRQWQDCIADLGLESAIRRLLGDTPGRQRLPGCSSMRLDIVDRRVTGRHSCMSPVSSVETRLEGRLEPTTLSIRGTRTRLGNRGRDGVEYQYRITARRIGDCAA